MATAFTTPSSSSSSSSSSLIRLFMPFRSQRGAVLWQSSSNNNNNNNEEEDEKQSTSSTTIHAQNEFSRLYATDRILKHRGSSHSRQQKKQQQQQNDNGYQVSIQATPQECQALSERFDWNDLTLLQAQVTLRPFHNNNMVEVEGTIQGHLTRTCVRSNEDFPVEIDCPIYALVPEVVSMENDDASLFFDMPSRRGGGGSNSNDEQQQQPKGKTNNNNNKGGNHKKNNKNRRLKSEDPLSSTNMNDMMDLQNLLDSVIQEQENENSGSQKSRRMLWNGNGNNGNEADYEDYIMEDEAIYSGGQLDVGELVAQTFWLQLDPYPKKPGTGPMEIEISG